MTKITVKDTMGALVRIPELREIAPYLLYSPEGAPPEFDSFPIAQVKNIGWSPEGMVHGLNFLIEQFSEERAKAYFVYSPEECADEPQKKDVNVVRLTPKKIDPAKPYIVLAAGGGYSAVCSAVEAYPTAVHMVKRGYQVFVLTYRVGGKGVLSKSLTDLAAALRFIGTRGEEFQLRPDCYAIGGFSAGANLISTWGTKHAGYGAFGMPKPKAMFPVYTLIDLESEKEREAQEDAEVEGMLCTMLGEDYTQEMLEKYNICQQITADYPPCYIVCGKDDTTVPCRNSELMKESLDGNGVPCTLEAGEHAAHGFGDGTGTDVEGWPQRAVDFLESL